MVVSRTGGKNIKKRERIQTFFVLFGMLLVVRSSDEECFCDRHGNPTAYGPPFVPINAASPARLAQTL